MILAQRYAQQLERLVEYGRPLSVGHDEQVTFDGQRRPQAEHRQNPFGCDRRQRGELLGDQHGVTAGQHRHRGADLQSGRAGKRERHADERVDEVRVDQLGEPQRVDAGALEMVDSLGQVLRADVGSKPDSETDFHTRLLA